MCVQHDLQTDVDSTQLHHTTLEHIDGTKLSLATKHLYMTGAGLGSYSYPYSAIQWNCFSFKAMQTKEYRAINALWELYRP